MLRDTMNTTPQRGSNLGPLDLESASPRPLRSPIIALTGLYESTERANIVVTTVSDMSVSALLHIPTFHITDLKHKLWLLIRTATARRF